MFKTKQQPKKQPKKKAPIHFFHQKNITTEKPFKNRNKTPPKNKITEIITRLSAFPPFKKERATVKHIRANQHIWILIEMLYRNHSMKLASISTKKKPKCM